MQTCDLFGVASDGRRLFAWPPNAERILRVLPRAAMARPGRAPPCLCHMGPRAAAVPWPRLPELRRRRGLRLVIPLPPVLCRSWGACLPVRRCSSWSLPQISHPKPQRLPCTAVVVSWTRCAPGHQAGPPQHGQARPPRHEQTHPERRHLPVWPGQDWLYSSWWPRINLR